MTTSLLRAALATTCLTVLLPVTALADLQIVPVPDIYNTVPIAGGMSPDGTIVWGWAMDTNVFNTGFVWDTTTNTFSLVPHVSYGFVESSVYFVSENGGVRIGDMLTMPDPRSSYYWTAGGGYQFVAPAAGDDELRWSGLSSDGAYAAGVTDNFGTGNLRAIRWSPNGGLEFLDDLGMGGNSWANAINADGTVIVGKVADTSYNAFAFRWVEGSGMTNLGLLPGGTYSQAFMVSSDGSVVVGDGDDTFGQQLWRWNGGALTKITNFSASEFANATAMTPDGNSVVYNEIGGLWPTNTYIIRVWNSVHGTRTLDNLPGSVATDIYFARAISADGTIVVGEGTTSTEMEAVRWVGNNSAPEKLIDMLAAAGVDTSAYVNIYNAISISADGQVILAEAESADPGSSAYRLVLITQNGLTTPGDTLESLQPTVQPGLQATTALGNTGGQSLLVARNALTASFNALQIGTAHV